MKQSLNDLLILGSISLCCFVGLVIFTCHAARCYGSHELRMSTNFVFAGGLMIVGSLQLFSLLLAVIRLIGCIMIRRHFRSYKRVVGIIVLCCGWMLVSFLAII